MSCLIYDSRNCYSLNIETGSFEFERQCDNGINMVVNNSNNALYLKYKVLSCNDDFRLMDIMVICYFL